MCRGGFEEGPRKTRTLTHRPVRYTNDPTREFSTRDGNNLELAGDPDENERIVPAPGQA